MHTSAVDSEDTQQTELALSRQRKPPQRYMQSSASECGMGNFSTLLSFKCNILGMVAVGSSETVQMLHFAGNYFKIKLN